MKFWKTLLCFGIIPACVSAQTPASTPPLSDANARAIHTAATNKAPSDLDIRFLQYQHEAGKPPAELLAELSAQNGSELEIRRQYREFLGRDPGAEEIAERVYRMSTNRLSVQALTRELQGSVEYRNRHAALIIHRVYRDLLERAPTPRCLELQTAFLLRENLSEEALRRQVMRSEEYHRRRIKEAYRSLLGRNPDASGMATYLERMQRRGWSIERVRTDIQRSPEYRARRG